MDVARHYDGSMTITVADLTDKARLIEKHRQHLLDPTVKQATLALDVMPNDKCPCGSGRKFKKCCMWLGRTAKARDGQAGG